MKNTILIVFCAVNAALWGGCKRPTSTQAVDSTHAADSTHADSTLTVEQLLANQQGHAHAMVKIRGCLDRGFEMLVLRSSCDHHHLAQCVWLEDAETEYAFTKFNRLHPKHKVPVIELSFQFDRARNSRAWKKVNASLENNIRSEIVLLGQFETGSGFGHMGAYPNELLLVDVLDNKSNPTP